MGDFRGGRVNEQREGAGSFAEPEVEETEYIGEGIRRNMWVGR